MTRANTTTVARTKAEWLEVLKNIPKGYTPAAGKEATYDSGHELMARLKELGVWKDGDSILDIGCGNGRLAIPLTKHSVSYVGIDTISESIQFCKEAFKPWNNFLFFYLPIQNDFYNITGESDPMKFQIISNKGAEYDVILFASVMTHLGRLEVCRHYLDEARNALKPNGKVYVTWFRGPPNDLSDSCERSVFTESDIINSLDGFTVEATWGGLTQEYGDQWHMVLTKKG